MNDLLDTALKYSALGLSVIAIDALKQSVCKWKTFQNIRPDQSQLFEMFRHPATQGVAVVTGESSGNLEAIDIDSKNYLQGDLIAKLWDEIMGVDTEITDKVVIARSRSGGAHIYYRCAGIGSNQPLARRPTTDQEKLLNPKEKVKVLIETRGIGGYIVVPPTPGYQFVQSDFGKIPVISKKERDVLLQAAQRFNVYQERKIERIPPKIRPAGWLSPLDDYNIRGDVIQLLQKHGWTVTGQTGNRTFLKRPGETDKRSSGSFNHELNYFSVFSTSTEFVPKAGYRPYAVYAMLECGGDFSLAYKKLASDGFGQTHTLKTPQYKSLRI